MNEKPIIHVLPDGQRIEGRAGEGWPAETVAPVKPLDPKRPTLSEIWGVNGRLEPYGS